MKVVIAGASGLIGIALTDALRVEGHEVRRLVRRTAKASDEIAWDPATRTIDVAALAGTQAVINLSGENVAKGRWTKRRRERIMRSRTDATRTLVAAMAELQPRPEVLVNASAVGFYGDRDDEVLMETATMGRGFLPEVVWAWETHADGAQRLGVRTVKLRFGVVLAAKGGALERMLPVFRVGLGGRLGSGRQWMSWVSIEDVVGVVLFALANRQIEGPVNVVAPGLVTNREFVRELGEALHRPAVVPAPAFALRAAFGKGMADEALLASTRAVPEVLRQRGYVFRRPQLAGALQSIL